MSLNALFGAFVLHYFDIPGPLHFCHGFQFCVFMVLLCVCEPDVSDPICGFGAFPLALSLLFVLFHLILF